MKTFTNYNDIPKDSLYIGSENGDGTMQEELAILIGYCFNPVKLKNEDGTFSYFALGEE